MYKLWENGTPLFDEKIDQPETTITPYLVESDKPTGAVIVFPGGGYCIRADHEGEPVAKMFNEAGISAFVLNYRVKPYVYPAQLFDAQRAIRFVRHNAKKFNIDPEKIGVLGFSAGGHLAVMSMQQWDLGLTDGDEIDRESSRPNAAILCYPVVGLTVNGNGNVGSGKNLLGDRYDELAEKLSGQNCVKKEDPPAFIWHTAEDKTVHVHNSLNLALKLRENEIPFELHIFPHGEHGLGLAENDDTISQWASLACKWLKKMEF